uniref:Uncharacterized protein n=1 Tax=Plectus sambesii TaxID=2011161 RepID=A0A914XL00_9BILA
MFGCMRNHYRYSSVRDPAQRPLPPPSQHPYPLTKGASDSGGIKLLDNWISYLFNEGSVIAGRRLRVSVFLRWWSKEAPLFRQNRAFQWRAASGLEIVSCPLARERPFSVFASPTRPLSAEALNLPAAVGRRRRPVTWTARAVGQPLPGHVLTPPPPLILTSGLRAQLRAIGRLSRRMPATFLALSKKRRLVARPTVRPTLPPPLPGVARSSPRRVH